MASLLIRVGRPVGEAAGRARKAGSSHLLMGSMGTIPRIRSGHEWVGG